MVDAAAGQVPPPFVFSPTACLTTDQRLTSVTPNPLTPSQAAVAKTRWRAPHPSRPPRTLLRHVDHARGASVPMPLLDPLSFLPAGGHLVQERRPKSAIVVDLSTENAWECAIFNLNS